MTAIIPIDDKYRIELDEYSWAVSKYAPRKDQTRKQWQQVSWHKTLQQAAENVRTRHIFESEPNGIDEALNALARSTHLLVTAIQESGIPDSWSQAHKLKDS